jgi:hypothetical protein
MCFGCRHEVILNVDKYPGDLLEFGPRMVCTKCGMVGVRVPGDRDHRFRTIVITRSRPS